MPASTRSRALRRNNLTAHTRFDYHSFLSNPIMPLHALYPTSWQIVHPYCTYARPTTIYIFSFPCLTCESILPVLSLPGHTRAGALVRKRIYKIHNRTFILYRVLAVRPAYSCCLASLVLVFTPLFSLFSLRVFCSPEAFVDSCLKNGVSPISRSAGRI